MRKFLFAFIVQCLLWIGFLVLVLTGCAPHESHREAVAVALPQVLEVRTKAIQEDGSLVEDGTGSGVIVGEQGYLLTCYHVISDTAEVYVDLGSQHLPAAVVAKDEILDLALLKVDACFGSDLVVRWGDSTALRPGDFVFVVGYPFDITELVSFGFISSSRFVINTPVLATDAPINPGNSGGGLFDSHGLLVGIPNRMYTPQRPPASCGIGFAIPGNTAHLFVIRNLP